MVCLKKYEIFIYILLNLHQIFGAPQSDGYTYPTDDDDRVISHVIDPASNETELFSLDSTNNDDRVVSKVIDMNSSDTSKLFNQFNISIEEVMRRINKQDQTNPHRNPDETTSDNDGDHEHDGNKESDDKG